MTEEGGVWHEGGCHCGAVRFRARIDDPRAVRCNCSYCAMRGDLQLFVRGEAFVLLAGDAVLRSYRFGTRTAHHRFCGSCGIHPFNHPRSHPEGVAVNARCLDGVELETLVVDDFDGQHWERSIATLRER